MINLGEYNTLEVARETGSGYYLKDDEDAMVLLPGKYAPRGVEIGQDLKVFILKDSDDRLVATTDTPKIVLNDFALLKVTYTTTFGAFVDWGMDKELLVPLSEQKNDMEIDRWYVVYMGIDTETNRLYASSKVNRYLQNQYVSVKEGDEVEILIYKKTDLGYSVIVNDEHSGLVFESDVFQELNVGDRLKAYVKTIRPDNKLDITLRPVGYDDFISTASEEVFKQIEAQGGKIDITDKSTPEVIYAEFKMSKKAFKKAVGDLYKQRKITITSEGITLV